MKNKKREKWFNAYWPIFEKKRKVKSLKFEEKVFSVIGIIYLLIHFNCFSKKRKNILLFQVTSICVLIAFYYYFYLSKEKEKKKKKKMDKK